MRPLVRRSLPPLLLVAALAGDVAAAQGPDAEWRTIELPHHRLHYPVPAEAWARHVAARLEPLHRIVAGLVGWTPEEKVEVILQDPVATANGFAWALPGRPRMVLWATPPAAGSQLAFFADWGELLVGHEQAHLTHLLRPSRNPWGRWMTRAVPLAPITRKSPRWVTEGYATLLEGRISGRGRPHAHLRAVVLREWARAGRLPGYGRLAADEETWLGMSMAYLVGSAYLQWLEDQAGPEALPHLWRRMTAREGRGFEEAFRGVFGDSPAALYGRFTAELVHRALELEEALEGLRREGDLWQDHTWGTGIPAVSPDGERIVYVRTDRELPPRLVVLSTGPDEEAEVERRERIERMLARDPEDVAPVEAAPPPREPLATLWLERSGGGAIPRWMGDGSILLTQAVPDPEGRLRWDLFRWWPDDHRLERLTRGADLRQADPAPGGAWALGLRIRWGATELVRIDLGTLEVETLVPGRIEAVLDSPRVSPDGGRIAYLRNAGEWELRIRELPAGEDRRVATPQATTLAHPAWRMDGDHLYLAVGDDGLLDLQAFPTGPGAEHHRVTRSLAGAFGPAPTPDGKFLYYLSLDADGVDVRRLPLDAATLQDVELHLVPRLVPVVAPAPGETMPVELSPVPASRPYGAGEPELSWFPQIAVAPAATTFGGGARAGDVLGRWNAFLAGSVAERGGAEGLTLAGAWRGWPVETTLQLYRAEERYSEQPEEVAAPTPLLDLDEVGVAATVRWERFDRRGRWEVLAAGGWAEVEPGGSGEALERHSVLGATGWSGEWRLGPWSLGLGAVAEGQTGSTGGEDWDRLGLRFELAPELGEHRLVLGARHDALEGSPAPLDRLRLGGPATTLRPPVADAHRFLDPALPAGIAFGDRGRLLEARLDTGTLPLSPFWRRYRFWEDGAGKGDWLDLAGLELAVDTVPFPLLGLPAARLRLGAAYVLDPPLEDEVTAWVTVAWKP